MTDSRPCYQANITARGGPYEVRVNDCPVLVDEQGAATSMMLPINHWLRDGANVLSARVGQSASGWGQVEVTIAHQTREEAPAVRLTLDARDVLDGEAGDDNAKPPTQQKLATFQACLPLPRWCWDQRPAVELKPKDQILINNEVFNLHSALDRRDLDALQAALADRSAELAQARYQSPEERAAEIRAQFEPLFEDPDWVLDRFEAKDLVYRQCGDRRLVQVKSAMTGESPVYLVNQASCLVAGLELFLYQQSPFRWRIIR